MGSTLAELLFYATEATNKYKQIDDEVKMKIQNHPEEAERHTLHDAWHVETRRAEDTTDKIVSKRTQWMKNLPQSDPYQGYSTQSTEPPQTRHASDNRRDRRLSDPWQPDNSGIDGDWRTQRPKPRYRQNQNFRRGNRW